MGNLAHLPDAEQSTGNVRSPLQADEAELRRFVEIVFRRCAGATGHIALRAFEHEGDGCAVVNTWAPFDTALRARDRGDGTDDAGREVATRLGLSEDDLKTYGA